MAKEEEIQEKNKQVRIKSNILISMFTLTHSIPSYTPLHLVPPASKFDWLAEVACYCDGGTVGVCRTMGRGVLHSQHALNQFLSSGPERIRCPPHQISRLHQQQLTHGEFRKSYHLIKHPCVNGLLQENT